MEFRKRILNEFRAYNIPVIELLGDDLKNTVRPKSKLRIAASCFSIYAFEALKKELEKVESQEFIFTSPTFVSHEVTDKIKKERREFFIPKLERERGFYGTEFEIQLRNKLTQRAIAKECADWIKKKAQFRSNRGKAPMQQFACVENSDSQAVYLPLHGFTAVDLGYQPGNAVSNIVNKIDEPMMAKVYLNLFDQIWNDAEKLEDVTERLRDHIVSVYQENSPERIYFLMLYNIFNEFLDDISEDVLPNDKTGYQDSLIWKKLFNFQRDAATGIINKLETYNGCILADSVGLGKTFTALAVVKYYELRNRSVLVLCPKKLADNWLTYNRNLTTNIFSKDRFNYDVLCHTDLQRTTGESFGTKLNQVNWGNYDLVVIDESHNFRNNDAFKERETRYQRLMNVVIKQGVKTKVLMLSATPVNNRFNDLKNQLALAYEGNSESLMSKLKSGRDVNEIFRRAQAAFNNWSKLPPEERTAEPSRLRKYEELYDTEVEGKGKLRQADREKSLQTLMTVNLLKRLESSVESFRITLRKLGTRIRLTLVKIEDFQKTGKAVSVEDFTEEYRGTDPEDDVFTDPEESQIGGKVQINLADMDLPSWQHDLNSDLSIIDGLLGEMEKITPDDDAKLQHVKSFIANKIAYPFNPGNRKILLFTAFADTANYLYAQIADELHRSQKLNMLFAFPPNAEFNRVIPKTKFYEHTSSTPSLKAKFVSQISQVVWSYKLAPETINLSPSEGVHEIQVFMITLKGDSNVYFMFLLLSVSLV
jgi:superfamily II DNA or RNA helicase